MISYAYLVDTIYSGVPNFLCVALALLKAGI